MKIVQITGPALAALLVACGASSQHASAPERAAQQAAEDKQEAQERAEVARQDADKARQKAEEAARAEHEAQWNAHMATQREAQAQAQVAQEAHALDVPHATGARAGMGVTERQADDKVKVVLFAADSSDLSVNAKAKLDEVSRILHNQPKANNVIVEGYTDDTGTEKDNVKLSRKRADEVANYLVGKGIARERISTKALGSHNPSRAAAGESPTLKGTLNRRVEIVILPAP
jgi:outer membrane protein OmpA-like peptidoglycan-associated protein